MTLAILFSLTLTLEVSAETVAQTARKWGLIGAWSLDCSLPLDRNKGTVLAYVIASDGRVLHRRNFGDSADESEVIAAEVSQGGILNARLFPEPQTNPGIRPPHAARRHHSCDV